MNRFSGFGAYLNNNISEGDIYVPRRIMEHL